MKFVQTLINIVKNEWHRLKLALWLFCLFVSSYSLYAQSIDLNKVTGGFTLKYLIPGGDFGSFWNKSVGAGVLLGYPVQETILLEGEITYSKFTPKGRKEKYPDIHFLEFSGGVKYNLPISKKNQLNFKAGIENTMFIFSGTAATSIYEQNKNESEFGFFILPGLRYEIIKGINLEFNLKILSILSSPESINILVPGINIYIL